ncbi:hypothetical protein ACFVH0_36720 [Streptomyces sp. NPDC127117]|uniref:hypothetical protein n=1 Tax=Streptomyces sp. NPDC127117 TaxID=3345368 RepID=UPI00363171F2
MVATILAKASASASYLQRGTEAVTRLRRDGFTDPLGLSVPSAARLLLAGGVVVDGAPAVDVAQGDPCPADGAPHDVPGSSSLMKATVVLRRRDAVPPVAVGGTFDVSGEPLLGLAEVLPQFAGLAA